MDVDVAAAVDVVTPTNMQNHGHEVFLPAEPKPSRRWILIVVAIVAVVIYSRITCGDARSQDY